MTVKILHVINGEHYAGAERVQDLLALQLPQFGYQVGFACTKSGLFADNRMARDVPLYDFTMRSRIDLNVAKRMAALVQQEGYAVIHTHTARSALLGAIASVISGIPMVHHVHSPTTRDTEGGWRNLRNALVDNLCLRRARVLIAVSDSLKHYLHEQGYGKKQIEVIANGVPLTEAVSVTRRVDEPLQVGMVALFRPRKGVEVLLKSMALLKQQGRRVHLHAVGPFETPEYGAAVMQLALELGVADDVTWVGFTKAVYAEFPKMHVFALPSLFGEGMPMVVLEAMAAGLPVVSTKVEGIPQVVREGQDGLLVEPNDAEALARALSVLAQDPPRCQSMGASARQRQIDDFSDVSMARGVAHVYDTVLGRSNTGE